jgi:hypothetical protein
LKPPADETDHVVSLQPLVARRFTVMIDQPKFASFCLIRFQEWDTSISAEMGVSG